MTDLARLSMFFGLLVAAVSALAGTPSAMTVPAPASAPTGDPTLSLGALAGYGAVIDETAVHQMVHVSPAGDDTQAGRNDVPFETLGAAVRHAMALVRQGQAVCIRLAPGIYREAVHLDGHGEKALLIIEGSSPQTTVISGSDDWSDPASWTPDAARPGVWHHAGTGGFGDYLTRVEAQPAGNDAPRDLVAASADDGSVALTWDAPPASAPQSYIVYRRRVHKQKGAIVREDNEFLPIAKGLTQTRFVDSDTTLSESADWMGYRTAEHHYKVEAVGADGRSIGFSNISWTVPGTRKSDMARLTLAGRLRDLVFVNGLLLRQRTSIEELTPGSFVIDEGSLSTSRDGRISVCLPEGVQMGRALTEVGVRPVEPTGGLLKIVRKPNLVIRNLTFQHATTRVWNADALAVKESSNVLIENCHCRWNNGGGLYFGLNERITVRRCIADDNGGTGMGGGGARSLLLEDCQTSRNTWRGDWGDLRGWFFAGVKTGFGLHDAIIRNHISCDNLSAGFWFDCESQRVTVARLRSTGNGGYGLVIEAVDGPITVLDSEIAGNALSGIHLATSRNGLLQGNSVHGNRRAQIRINPRRERTETFSAGKVVLRMEHWTWDSNTVEASSDQPLVEIPAFDFFFKTFQSRDNRWIMHSERPAFIVEKQPLEFAGWQERTGQDRSSRAILERDD